MRQHHLDGFRAQRHFGHRHEQIVDGLYPRCRPSSIKRRNSSDSNQCSIELPPSPIDLTRIRQYSCNFSALGGNFVGGVLGEFGDESRPFAPKRVLREPLEASSAHAALIGGVSCITSAVSKS